MQSQLNHAKTKNKISNEQKHTHTKKPIHQWKFKMGKKNYSNRLAWIQNMAETKYLEHLESPLSLKLTLEDPSLIKTEVWFQMKHYNHCYSFHSTHYQSIGGLWKPAKCLTEVFLPITDRNPWKGRQHGRAKVTLPSEEKGTSKSIYVEPHSAF